MSEMLEKVCQDIEQEYLQNSVLCIEQMFPALKSEIFEGMDIVLLSTKDGSDGNEEVIPTLSVCKSANSIPKSVLSISELWFFFKDSSGISPTVKPSKSLKDILDYAISAKYYVHKFPSFRTVILVRHNENFREEDKLHNKLARSLFFVRQKSQNLLNDSNQLADKNREELQEQFTEDLHSAVDTISKYIEEKFGVAAFALKYSDRKNEWSCKQACPLEITDTVNMHIDRVSDQVKPIAGFSMNKYFIIFPFISTLVRRDLQSLILIQSERPIPTYIITNLRYFTNYYFAVYLEERKSDLLESLQKKTLGLYSEIERMINSGHEINPRAQMKQFLEPAFRIALQATNAFSASLRLYSPEIDSLELVYASGSDRVENATSQNKDRIPAKDIDKSQVAYVFKTGKPGDEGNYIPNIEHIRGKSGSKYREHRTNSQSELCFCIFFKQIAVGVLNFESPQKNGFQHDRNFLKKIRTSLENYITALYESNDKQWLARRSKIYQNLHEIKNVINSDYFPKELTQEIDKFIEVNETVDRSIEPVSIIEIERFRDTYIDSYTKELEHTVKINLIRDEMIKEFPKGCMINISNVNKSVPHYKMNLLLILYKNLLDNYRKWSASNRDYVRVRDLKDSNLIEFKVVSSTLFDEKILNKLLIEPYTTTTQYGNKAHYGMFIVGMIARHLGGYAYVLNKNELDTSQLIIQIPI